MLYIDIGATFLKFLYQDAVTRIEMPLQKTISVNWIKGKILEFIKEKDIDEIAFSCQMHGYVIEGTDQFETWKNQSYIPEFLKNKQEEFTLKTGLFCRNDLPISNLYSQISKNLNLQNKKIKIIHISEALCDLKTGKCSREMACGTGFYDIINEKYLYLDQFKADFNVDLDFDQVSDYKEISGYINHGNKKIKCYVGLGDMQCSLYGAGLKENQISINMATGSQISKINKKETFTNYEVRPYFGRYLKCITHIPSGRFLLMFEKLIPDLFAIFSKLNLEQLLFSSISFDLNFENIKIENITEDCNKEEFCASLLRAYLEQYSKISEFVFDSILLSGGIAKKINLISEYFLNCYSKDIYMNNFDDDSLLGLKKLFSVLQ